MTSNELVPQFNWTKELEKTVIQSLTTTFGLDFLLFEDKKGGNVDTIHNARAWQKGDKDINMSQDFHLQMKKNSSYNSKAYHSNKNYINTGRRDKTKHQSGKLYDLYRGKIAGRNEDRHLDHNIAASTIHHDAGRVLSGLDGVDLANQASNLYSTHGYVNIIKRDHSPEKFISTVAPNKLNQLKKDITDRERALRAMPNNSPEERHKKRELQADLDKQREKANALEDVLENKEEFLKVSKQAEKAYNRQINIAYYTSSRFLKNTAISAANSGIKMGTRQALGLVFAEIWFELKESFPQLFKKHKNSFKLELFLKDIQESFKAITQRIKSRFKDLLVTFKDSAIGGFLSSITTTLANIFFTTYKQTGKLIRELWQSLVQAAKLLFFNPQKLSLDKLWQQVLKILGAGISVALGVVLNQYLSKILIMPFGTEIAAFLSALTTGILTIGFTYFLEHSDLMSKVWHFLERFKSSASLTLDYYRKVNEELDRYLAELAEIELNLNPNELAEFADALDATSSELERSIVLNREIARKEIDLPFETDNTSSIRDWLMKKQL